MTMRGLDNWIMGINDPTAPFNQTDWTEMYEPILEECAWITDEMLRNEDTYQKLQNTLVNDVLPFFFDPAEYCSIKNRIRDIQIKAKEIADMFKLMYYEK